MDNTRMLLKKEQAKFRSKQAFLFQYENLAETMLEELKLRQSQPKSLYSRRIVVFIKRKQVAKDVQ
jgi:hypothetical protein